MTTQEAIKIIREDGWSYPETMKMQAIMMAVDALEKQTPKLVPRDGYDYDICPVCGTYLPDWQKYCSSCGQALEWDFDEEDEYET